MDDLPHLAAQPSLPSKRQRALAALEVWLRAIARSAALVAFLAAAGAHFLFNWPSGSYFWELEVPGALMGEAFALVLVSLLTCWAASAVNSDPRIATVQPLGGAAIADLISLMMVVFTPAIH